MLASFSACVISSSFCMNGFAPIASLLSKTFDVDILAVNMCNILQMIAYVPMNFIVISILDLYGCKICVRLFLSKINSSNLVLVLLS